jgi:hypothetical protein
MADFMRFQTFRSQSSAVAVHGVVIRRLKMSDNSGVRNILSDKEGAGVGPERSVLIVANSYFRA